MGLTEPRAAGVGRRGRGCRLCPGAGTGRGEAPGAVPRRLPQGWAAGLSRLPLSLEA